ncbi:MAG: hypothetical protein ABEH88_08540 [Halobacteriales archaeon]
MSVERGIQKVERGDRVAVIDVETGAAGEGETYPEALEDLATVLRAIGELAETAPEIEDLAEAASETRRAAASLESMQNTSELIRLAGQTQTRFAEEDVDEELVDEAIAWARSE